MGVASTGEFDASYNADPAQFKLGVGMVIAGWDQGVQGMPGGRRARIPPHLAYGRTACPAIG